MTTLRIRLANLLRRIADWLYAPRVSEPRPTPQTPADLWLTVRAGFIVRGISLTAWCRANNVTVQNARVALLGGWTGPEATALVQKIADAAGVNLKE